MKRTAIIILNYNTFDDTLVCVNSLKQYSLKDNDQKIFIIDNGSPDVSGIKLKEFYDHDERVEVILSKSNLGFSRGNNIGIKKAIEDGYETLILMNSDVILLNDAITEIDKALYDNDNIAIVGPAVYSPEMNYVQFARRPITLQYYLFDKKGLDIVFKNKINKLRFLSFDREKNFIFDGMVSGCCFAMKTEFVKEAKCLDPTPFMYYEEDILAYKLKKFNKKCAIASKAKIIHNEGTATGKSNPDKMLFTRLYRWNSSLYVLREYAHIPKVIARLIALTNIMNWLILSLSKPQYRKSLQKFINETKRVLKEKEI